jgi:8-oxo-dGTP diphosphatase
VAALLERDDKKVLITQRRPQAFMPLKWEFPGGKVEAGESDETALTRELVEELGIQVEVGEHFMGLTHCYPEFDLDFHVYQCRLVSGSPRKIAVHNFRWVTVGELDKYDFPPADLPTVKQLLE